MGVTYKPGLSNTHHHTVFQSSSQLSAKQCLLQKYMYLLGKSSLRIRQLSLRILSICALAVRAWKLCRVSMKNCENCKNCLLNLLKTCKNLALYDIQNHNHYYPHILHTSYVSGSSKIQTLCYMTQVLRFTATLRVIKSYFSSSTNVQV